MRGTPCELFHLFLLLTALSAASAVVAQGVEQGQVVAMKERDGTVTLKLSDGNLKQYRLKDGLIFNAVQAGDSIRFATEQENGQLVVSEVEKQ
jgi:Cu/Ag efflux protein CusF